MRIKILIGLLLVCSFSVEAQLINQFKKLGCAEKWWVITHPFVANKTAQLSLEVKIVANSDTIKTLLGKDGNGGALDAFRHTYWMAILTKEIGSRRALKLGEAHEKKNKQDFKKGLLEDGAIPDSVSIQMDLFNNQVGSSLVVKKERVSISELQMRVIEQICSGKTLVVDKNEKAQSLDINGNVLIREEWEGNWDSGRVLVPSSCN